MFFRHRWALSLMLFPIKPSVELGDICQSCFSTNNNSLFVYFIKEFKRMQEKKIKEKL